MKLKLWGLFVRNFKQKLRSPIVSLLEIALPVLLISVFAFLPEKKDISFEASKYATDSSIESCLFGGYNFDHLNKNAFMFKPEFFETYCNPNYKPFVPRRVFDGTTIFPFFHREIPIYFVEDGASCDDAKSLFAEVISNSIYSYGDAEIFCYDDPSMDPNKDCAEKISREPKLSFLQDASVDDPLFDPSSDVDVSAVIVCQENGTYQIRYDRSDNTPKQTGPDVLLEDGFVPNYDLAMALRYRYGDDMFYGKTQNIELWSLLSSLALRKSGALVPPDPLPSLSAEHGAVIEYLSRGGVWRFNGGVSAIYGASCLVCHETSVMKLPEDLELCRALNEIFVDNADFQDWLTLTTIHGPQTERRCSSRNFTISNEEEIALFKAVVAWFSAIVEPLTNLYAPVQFKESSFPTVESTTYDVVNSFGWVNMWCIAWIVSVCLLISALLKEKESKVRATLETMGVERWIIWTSWWLFYIVWFGLLSLIFTINAKFVSYNNSNFVVLFLTNWIYSWTLIAYAVLISAIFPTAKKGTAIGGILYILMTYPITASERATSAISVKKFACLFNQSAYYSAHTLTLAFEKWGTNEFPAGLFFSNLGKKYRGLSMGEIWGFLILGSFLYFIVGWYLSEIIADNDGNSRRWYFLFTPSYWKEWGACCKKEAVSEITDFSDLRQSDNEFYEKLPENYSSQPAYVEMKNLCREFVSKSCCKVKSRVLATKDTTATAHKGEIFVLLGHNGAGKTTTISMLTGMLQPTGGSAKIMGFDISRDTREARKNIGFCPQHDILYDFMTVGEHLDFYARMKGKISSNEKEHIMKIAEQLDLLKHERTRANKISGGERRRLSIASAFAGKNSVVFLDEPSTGMDVFNRRALWETLRQVKEDTCIILTTHSMEEADFLADRIGIYSKGDLVCMGSPFFLKKKFGLGYQMTVTKSEISNEEISTKCDNLILDQIPGSKLGDSTPYEVKYLLPFEAQDNLLDLVKSVETKSEELGIVSFSISVTTLDEVFIKVYDITHPEEAEAEEKRLQESSYAVLKECRDSKSIPPNFYMRFHRHFSALMIRYWNDATQKWGEIIPNILLTPVFIWIVFAVFLSITAQEQPSIPTSFESMVNYPYRNQLPQIVPIASEAGVSSTIQATFKSCSSDFFEVDFDPSITGINPFEDKFQEKYYEKESDRWYNSAFFLTENLPSSLLRNFSLDLIPETDPINFNDNDLTFPITGYLFHNSSFIHSIPAGYQAVTQCLLDSAPIREALNIKSYPLPRINSTINIVSELFYIYLTAAAFGFALWPALGFVIEERKNGTKHTQEIFNVNIFAYYVSQFVYSTIIWSLCLGLSWILFEVYQLQFVATWNARAISFGLFILFHFSAHPFLWILSWTTKDPNNYFSSIIALAFAPGLVLFLFKGAFNLYWERSMKYWFCWLPHVPFLDALINVSISRQIKMSEYAFKAMGTSGLIYWIIAVYLDVWNWRKPSLKCCKSNKRPIDEMENELEAKLLDKNVQNMEEEAERLVSTQETTPLLVYDEWKIFKEKKKCKTKNKQANRGMNLLLREYETVGILGVNGSGKSTLMKIITGLQEPTYGKVKVVGHDTTTDRVASWGKIGYCSQDDGFFLNLTGLETLRYFARLCYLPESRLESLANDICDLFDIGNNRNRPVKTYSGGNKRKLVLAISLLCEPNLLLLDEPSSGVDVKNKMLNSVARSAKITGRSVLFSTHEIPECESMSDYIAIVSNGKILAFGTSAYIKQNFGKGFQVEIQFNQTGEEGHRASFMKEFEAQFIGTKVLESMGSKIRLEIPNPEGTLALSSVFEFLNSNQGKYGLENFTASNASLESIFYQLNESLGGQALEIAEEIKEVTKGEIEEAKNQE